MKERGFECGTLLLQFLSNDVLFICLFESAASHFEFSTKKNMSASSVICAPLTDYVNEMINKI